MIAQSLPDAVEILVAQAATDAYGDAVESWAEPRVFETRGFLQARATSEAEGQVRAQSRGEWALYLDPAGLIPSARDRVRIAGRTFTIDGEPTISRGVGSRSGFVRLTVRSLEG